METTRSLAGGRGKPKGDGVVATVKTIDKAPDRNEQKVKVKKDGGRKEDYIYVPRKYAKYLKPEHKYQFHLEDSPFRGGGQSRFSGAEMIQRTRYEPIEITETGFGGGSMGGGTGFRSL